MKEIKYRTTNGILMLTPCPYRVGDYVNRVGSAACVDCKYHEGMDKEKQVVTCSFEKEDNQ